LEYQDPVKVADNASCGVYLLGKQKADPRKVDLTLAGMVLEKTASSSDFLWQREVMQNHQDPTMAERAQHMDRLIRKYFDGCNDADVDKMMSCFTPGAVHYFPPGMYDGPFRGARKIAEKWRDAVRVYGSYWTVDKLLVEPLSFQAVMEWTHFKVKQDTMLRGIEWYEFDASSGLIKEIRAYYASPQSPDFPCLELGGFDYAGRGYPVSSPVDGR
jgi:hypothetical protein